MLIWINGPFGGGKTATAYELHRRQPGSAVCDPEHVGFGMRRMLPAPLRGNFQDLPAWRHSITELLRLTLAAYDRPVIVPMTLINRDYFQEIIGKLGSRPAQRQPRAAPRTRICPAHPHRPSDASPSSRCHRQRNKADDHPVHRRAGASLDAPVCHRPSPYPVRLAVARGDGPGGIGWRRNVGDPAEAATGAGGAGDE